MGNVLSPTTTTRIHASTKLSEADSQALTAFLRHKSEQPVDSGTSFEKMLWTYLHSDTTDGDNSSDPAQLFGELVNFNKYTQADAIYRLGRLETVDFSTFAGSVCSSAIAEFWNQESPRIVDSTAPWVVEWVMPKETSSIRSIDAWHAWWRQSAILREMVELALRSALHQSHVMIADITEANLSCPKLSTRDLGRMLGSDSLLTAELGWMLSRELPAHSRKHWQCAYSSRHDGRSWSTFQGAIENRGSILLLVSEKKKKRSSQRVFGAYLDGEAVRLPSWHGTSQNFLFSADSATGLSVYRATGFNDNYQYLNYAMQTLPNGLGIGGQLEHFGLWIDSGFVNGSSNPTATYDSPQLSTQYDFAIGSIEAWVVRASSTASDSSSGQTKVSAVVANPEAAALLEMANRPMYSAPIHRSEPTS
ncbi:hypothetical protein GGI01_002204 [Coemansia sp. RSA 376]|nr:hypothetical protein H4S03_005537 [Coemansia sp. S3946]KAJ2261552.1 hypothetical protein GGI01_002204 [Coemansia sp. RSA 376]KAJ2354148.1 hypothetical protein GGH92_000219 [Coemansia sp. RSA 2673]